MSPAATLAFTVFRPETLPFAAEAMRGCGLILLEEPQTPGFEAMLAGELPVQEYLLLTEFEFPEYAAAQCELLRGLHRQDVAVRQVHPWLDELVGIHEFFAAGNGPADLPSEGPVRRVYERERIWTGALMAFYEASGRGAFGEIVAAVNAFAREDARKIADMDAARAAAVARQLQELPHRGRAYVECGSIHLDMVLLLRRHLGPGRLRVTHLMEAVCKPRHGLRRLLPPGDVLTFRHLLQAPADQEAESLLAARAMVYNKLIAKEELQADTGEHPHMDNEALVIGLVSDLDYAACEAIYDKIRRLPPAEALQALRGRRQ